MSTFYADASVSIRDDLAEAHRLTVEGWARPGNWWSAAERLAMIDEVRRARTSDEMPPWVRATTIDGLTDRASPLPEAAIDAVWRLTNHPGTLTEDWYRETIARGLRPEAYVELVGVVATANCLDVFADAIGVDSRPLPAAAEGEPDQTTMPGVAVSTHWVPTAPVKGANVGKALTSVPVAAEAWRRLSDAQYVPPEALIKDLAWSRGALDRMQVELLAARTSLLNECFY